MSFLGVDIGTTGVRAAVYDRTGRKLAICSEAYGCDVRPGGHVESDAEGWWAATMSTCAALAAAVPMRDVEGVGVVGQAPTAVLVDSEGRAIRPAILWLDVRASDEALAIGRKLGPGRAEALGGNRLHPYYLVPP